MEEKIENEQEMENKRQTDKLHRGRHMGRMEESGKWGSLTVRDNHKQTDRYKAIVFFHAK